MGFDEARLLCSVAQHPTYLAYMLLQDLWLDACPRPDGLHCLLMRDELTRMFHEMAQ
jgi:hypothetical protein